MLLEDTLAVLSLGKLCEDHGYTYHWTSGRGPHLTKKGQQNSLPHIKLCTIRCPWFIDEFLCNAPHLLLHHLHSQDSVFHVGRYTENPVPKRSGNTSEELRGNPLHEPQKPKTNTRGIRRSTKRYIAWIAWIGYRNSERIWLMKVLQQSLWETQSKEVQVNFWTSIGGASKSGTRFGLAKCLHALSEGPKLWYLLEDKNNKGFLQKTCWYSRAQSGTCWWLDYSGSQSSQWRKWIAEQSSICRGGTRLATQWIQSYPGKTKTSQETQKSLMKFLDPTRKPKVIYTDNSMEFGKSCEELSWNHCTSTPHRSETNGIAERAVRRVKEGTSAVLLQSSLDNEWWADSMECYCYLRNIQDLLSGEKTPYERRFGMPFNGPVIPFGAMVEYYPISATDISRLQQFGPKVLPGIFLGYALYAGGIWKRRHIMVADIEELEEMDASELHARRLNAKEVLTPMKGDNFIFPVADGTVKPAGGDRRLKPSTLIRDRPERGEEQEILRGESGGLSSPSPHQEDSTRDDAEAKNEFWSIMGDFIYRHHVEIRVRCRFGSSRDPSPRLEFPLHLPSRQPHQDSIRVRFLFAVYIAWPLLLVALSSSVGNLVVPDRVRSLWWNMDTKLGGSQLRAEPVGRLSRGRTSHWQISSPSRV